MAFVYESVNGNTLTKSQELLLDTIENLPFPFGGISKLKDLRTKTQLKVLVTDRKAMLKDWERYMDRYKVLHGEFFGVSMPRPVTGIRARSVKGGNSRRNRSGSRMNRQRGISILLAFIPEPIVGGREGSARRLA